MSKTVDHRVVEMRFDNKQFEAGAKQTMSTLTRLKEALKLPDTAKALEGIDKATKDISLDGIASGVEALNNRFSTLGIVGMRVIENITDGLMNKLHRAVSFVTDSIVSGGVKRAMNIENAHFQLQALLKDETKVQAVMADAMESVDGTAYAYDEAAKAASQFAASGLQAGEEMLGALKGITGVAAMTNSSFEDISRIFTTVAGNGRLMGDQLLQLSSRGLNAASTLADYFKEVRGQSNMTEATIRDMVSKGKISFKDFSDAMTWAFGDSAKRANETFTGAFSNMKSALARIGAGFISPLVEQNGELVQLFNALRIKINDVKSALVFDEQTSAIKGLKEQTSLLTETYAEMFRTGTLSTDTFVNSILKANEVEDKFGIKSNYLNQTFEKLKESGKVTTDMLSGMANMGIDATASIREYVNGVHNGTIKASESIKKMADELASAMGPDKFLLSEDQIKNFAKEGKIDFELFSEAIVRSSKESIEASGVLEDALKAMFSEVKKEGHLSSEALEKFSKNGIDAGDAVRKYMKGVRDGTIRASYATRTAIEELTDGVVITTGTINKFAEEGKITYDIFQSAMENSFGNSKALSKQFTDSFQDMIHKIVVAINEMDMTKPMEAFYYGVESIKNIAKGLWSVLKPIGAAFSDVFLDFNGDDVINFASAIETLTAKMRLSEKGSQNLHDAFEGIFSIAKLLVDIFFSLFGAILPINKPVMEMGDGFLGVVGAIGRAITYFTKMIRSCTLLKKAFNVILSPISLAMNALTKLIKMFKDFGKAVINLEGAQKLFNAIENAFVSLGKKAIPYIEDFIGAAEEMFKSLFNIEDFDAEEVLGKISKALSDLAWEIENFSFQRTVENFENFIQKIKDLAMANESFETFVTNVKKYAGKLKEAFSFDAITGKIEKVMNVFSRFSKWVKTTLSPALKAFFDGFSIGNAVGVAGGIGVLFAVIKAIKAIEKIGGALQSVISLIGAAKGTLVAWQKDLKADAFLKISKGILALAIAITVLSFADMKNAWQAAIMLGLVGSALIAAIGYFMKAINKGNDVNQALGTFAKGLSKSMQSFTKSLKIKAIGSVIKNVGLSLMLIAGSIIALGIMYSKNPDAMNKAVELVKDIGLVILGVGVLSAIISKFINEKAMSSIGKSLLMTMLSLTLAVSAISKLMKMDIPDDADVKIKLLEHIMVMLGGMALVLGVSALISGGNQLPKMTKSIKALVVLLVATVASLYVLFKMNIPNDYEKRFDMLSGIFNEMELLILVIGVASRIAGGHGLKAAGTILSLIPLIVTIVGALLVLTLIPEDKMMAGAKALGGIILTLAVALAGAGQIEKGSAAAKTVLAMAIMVGVITAALAILALVPFESLMKSTVALGLVLLTLSENFKNVAKVQSKKALPTIIAMIGAVTVISVALYELSKQPWENMLSAAAAMSVTLLAFSKSFEMILGKRWSENNVKKIGTFLLMTLAVIPIGVAIGLLAQQPWQSLLTAAVTLSGVALALTGVFFILTKVNPDIQSIVAFVAGAVALIPMAVALNMLSEQSWDSILPAIVALGAVSAILVAAMMVMSLAGPGILSGIVAFVAGAVAMIPIAMVMNMLTGLSWNDVATGLVTLAGALVIIGVAGLAGIAIAPGLLALSVALIAFGAAITVVGVGLLAFTASLVASIALLEALFGTIGEAIPNFIDLGKNLIGGFIGGILEGFESLIATVKEVAGGILTGIAEVLGIHSPSTEAWDLAKYTDEGFAIGLEDNSGIIDSSVDSVFGGIKDKINTDSLYGSGEDATGNFTNGLLSGEGDISSALSGALSDATSGFDMSQFSNLGELGSSEMLSGLTNGLDIGGIQNALSNLGEGFDTSQFFNMGELGSEGFLNGFDSNFDVTQIQDSITGSLGEGFDTSQFFTTGEESSNEFIEGFKTGTNNNINDVAVEIANLLNESIGKQDFSVLGAESIKEFVDSAIKVIKSKRPEFMTEGKESINSWINGIKNKYPDSVTTAKELADKVIAALKEKYPEFLKTGTESASKYLEGFKSKYSEASSIGKGFGDNILKSLESIKESFSKSGINAGAGFVEGLKSQMEEAAKAGAAIGKAAHEASKKALNEHSPSKKMGEVGENAGLGFINKLMLYVAKAAETGKEIGEAAVSGISFVLDDNISDPIIRPTVDLSDVNSSFNEIRDQFNEAISTAASMASSISTTLKVNNDKVAVDKQPRQTVVNNYNMEQNNYSPKALSAVDIYRQTNNQFSRLKSSIKNQK